MDTQQVETLGRNRLIDELVRGGVEVAMPMRDRGVDLIAYIDIGERAGAGAVPEPFSAVPIQMKAATGERFSLSRKYERLANLLLVYVWGIASASRTRLYAMTYREALAIAAASGWTRTPSWRKGRYAATRVSSELRDRLEPHRMTTERWKPVVRAASNAGAHVST